MLSNKTTIMRLMVFMAVSLGLHGAAVLFDWYDAPSEPAAVHNVLEVSLVTAKAVIPEPESFEKPSDASPPTQAPGRTTPEPVPSSQRAEGGPRSVEPEPIDPEPEQPGMQQSEMQQAKSQQTTAQQIKPEPARQGLSASAAPSKPPTGPESVFQCIDLLCSARGNSPGDQSPVSSQLQQKLPAQAAAHEAEPAPVAPSATSTPAEAELINARPRYQSNPLPEYPYLARQRHWEGRAWLLVTVSAGGGVLDLEVAESSGYGVLDKSAIKTVRRWRFLPARRSGAAVASQVKIPVEFRLEE